MHSVTGDDHGDSKRLEAEHAQLQQRYAESQERFAEVFRLAPCVMLITRLADHVILDVNAEFERQSGYPRAEVVGRSTGQFPWWHDPNVRDRVLSDIGRQGFVSQVETTFVDRDGKTHYTLVSGQRISTDGQPCVVWQTVDITESVRAAEEKRELEQRIQRKEKLESLGLLAGGIAHDFNNLLVAVLGNAEAALFYLSPDHPARPLIRAVVNGGERAAELTRELLDYAGRGTTRLGAIETLSLLRETADLVRPALPQNVGVRVECGDVQLWVQGDASQLRRLFLNLIKNAAESFEGKPGEVLITAQSEQDLARQWVSVYVRDQGRGMDAATQARVFDPFFTTKPSGHGLGLASVQGIALKHGGSISVVSAVDEGTTFCVKLPRHPAPELSPEDERTENFRGHGTVLVLDDEPNVRATVGLLLELHGFEWEAVASGEAGIEKVRQAPDRYRAIMLDCTMPGLDGSQTLAALRVLRPELPVVMCSGYSQQDLSHLLSTDEHTVFLGKPFRRQDLVHALQQVLHARESALRAPVPSR